ncbi:MAG: hypothetical protein M3494_00310 [Actinomycetota bacterium]|jgi:hypothetical protein|nr:hypothetical protein [Rubrobacter sp.]MDQ3506455.1 hypothetical protein [Actinomycetota bacterium]
MEQKRRRAGQGVMLASLRKTGSREARGRFAPGSREAPRSVPGLAAFRSAPPRESGKAWD